MSIGKFVRVLFLLVVLIATSQPVYAADKEEDTSINNETLTGGIIRQDGYYLPKSTQIPVTLRTPIDSRVNNIGDMITAQTTEPLMIGGHMVVPARSFLHGHITQLERPGRFHRAPKLNIKFDSLSLPGSSGKRRRVNLVASVNTAEVLKQAQRVNDGSNYKSRVKKYGAVGAATGALAVHGATRMVPEYTIFGNTMLSSMGYFAAGALGGAAIASSLIKKDDVRMEPGTEMIVTVDASTMENFEQVHPLSNENLKDLSPEDAYDTFGTIKSEPLSALVGDDIEEKLDTKAETKASTY
jgi:hypothetical protein